MFTKLQLLTSFDPSLKNQLNNIKNKTQIVEAGKESQKDFVGLTQWGLFAIILVAVFMGFHYSRKHDWKKAVFSWGTAILAGIFGWLILPSFV
jgi:hypothetical protein